MLIVADHGSNAKNPAHIYLATLTPKSRKSISCQLRGVAKRLTGDDSIDHIRWSNIDRSTVLSLMEMLRIEGKAPSTINHALTAVRKVCEEAYHLGQISRPQYDGIMRVARDKGQRVNSLAPPTRQQVRDAIEKRLADTRLIALRDATLVATLAGAGLRKAEAVGCLTHNYNEGKLRIVGKGNREAIQPVSPSGQRLIEEYVTCLKSGPLFPAWFKNDSPSTRHLSPAGIDKVVDRVLPGVTPHRLRHAYASWLAEDGHNLAIIQRLMRHSTPALTMRYIHNDAAQQAASDELTF